MFYCTDCIFSAATASLGYQHPVFQTGTVSGVTCQLLLNNMVNMASKTGPTWARCLAIKPAHMLKRGSSSWVHKQASLSLPQHLLNTTGTRHQNLCLVSAVRPLRTQSNCDVICEAFQCQLAAGWMCVPGIFPRSSKCTNMLEHRDNKICA